MSNEMPGTREGDSEKLVRVLSQAWFLTWVLKPTQCNCDLRKGCPEMSQVGFWEADSNTALSMQDVY